MPAPDDSFLNVFLDEAKDILDAWERSALAFGPHSTREDVDALFRAAHNLKGSSRSVGLAAFGTFVHKIEDLMADVGAHRVPKSEDVRNVLVDSYDTMTTWIDAVRNEPGFEPDCSVIIARIDSLRGHGKIPETESSGWALFEEPTPSDGTPSTAASSSAGGMQTAHPGTGTATEETAAGRPSPSAQGLPPSADKRPAPEAEETIRIPAKKIDAIFRDLSELSIQMAIMEHLCATHDTTETALRDTVDKAAKLVRSTQEEVLALRMLPLRGLFQRLERTILDIGRKLGKKVIFQTQGGETELDKYVIEQIKDPLIHIIRNAMDHGLESSEQRLAAQKLAEGSVTIRAVQRSGSVEITIADDGRGLDEDRILRKAQEKGLIAADEKLTPQAVRNLIFMPGFSTAEKVSDISGRGVGMDVVKTAITTLRGQVTIASIKNRGTTFTITLPSTLSLFDVLIVESNDRSFAVPMSDIVEIVETGSGMISARDAKGHSIVFHDKMMPLVALHDRLGLAQGTVPTMTQGSLALIGQSENGMAAITVDRILGQKAVVTRPMSGGLKKLAYFSGMTLLGNGEPCLILDMRKLTDGILTDIHQSELTRVA